MRVRAELNLSIIYPTLETTFFCKVVLVKLIGTLMNAVHLSLSLSLSLILRIHLFTLRLTFTREQLFRATSN